MQQKLHEILSLATGWMTAGEVAEKGEWRSPANVGIALGQMEKADGRVERRKSPTKKMANGMPETEWKLTEKAFAEKSADIDVPVIRKARTTDQSLQLHATEVAVKHYNAADELREKLALAERQRDEHFDRAEDNERAYSAWMAFAKEYECNSIPELRVFIDSCVKRIDTLAGKSADVPALTEPAGYLVTSPNKAPRKFIKERTAKAAAASAAKAAGIAEIFAIHPHLKAVRGVEFKEAA
jgi:hypothetical protein